MRLRGELSSENNIMTGNSLSVARNDQANFKTKDKRYKRYRFYVCGSGSPSLSLYCSSCGSRPSGMRASSRNACTPMAGEFSDHRLYQIVMSMGAGDVPMEMVTCETDGERFELAHFQVFVLV